MSEKIKNSCFLINVLNVKNETIDRGTGFFINNTGYFISAGHVFKREGHTYNAEIEGNIHEIIEVYSEYIKPEEYTSHLYKDLFFGQINTIPSDYLSLSAEKLPVDTDVKISGYNRLIKSSETSEFTQLQTSVDRGACHKVNKEIDDIFVLRNAFKIVPVTVLSAGLSGGPITVNDICYGILNTAGESLSTSYILDKLEEQGIVFDKN